jgi:chromosome segregation ATPase
MSNTLLVTMNETRNELVQERITILSKIVECREEIQTWESYLYGAEQQKAIADHALADAVKKQKELIAYSDSQTEKSQAVLDKIARLNEDVLGAQQKCEQVNKNIAGFQKPIALAKLQLKLEEANQASIEEQLRDIDNQILTMRN